MGIIGDCTKLKEKSSIEKLFFVLFVKILTQRSKIKKILYLDSNTQKKENDHLFNNDTSSFFVQFAAS